MFSLANLPLVTGLMGNLSIGGTSFLTTLVALLGHYLSDLTSRPVVDIVQDKISDEYDFIIVGGGSAGSVLANRLSEISDWKILLLEAGLLENAITDIPILADTAQLTVLDWQYKTEPTNTFCLATNNHICNWPRGKVLGGSSVLNTMIYVRGNRRDYDHWESLGNTGWGYKDVLPYFIKLEDTQTPELLRNGYHGSGGYLTIQELPYVTPLGNAFVEAGIELGYAIHDYNAENQTSFSIMQATMRRGSRCSTAKAYVAPASHRPNLHISLESHVLKVLIDPETKVAYGVQYSRLGVVKTARARKEVILSAGTIGSAQLLMLSGIGPEEHLQELGIPVLQDLRVGHNLQDHVALYGGLTFLVNQSSSLNPINLANLRTVGDYVLSGDGPLTRPGRSEALAFIKTKYADQRDDYPDSYIEFIGGSTNSDFGVQLWKAHGLSESFYNAVFAPLEGKEVYSLLTLLLRPRSRGVIKLKSKNPYEHPLIYPNYFDDPMDLAVLIEGVKLAFEVGQTQAFRRHGSQFYDKKWPGCEHLEHFTDAMWECMIRQYTFSDYHLVGTVKMGPVSDSEAVIDPQLRVYGIEGLRVIDASIMPTVVTGNTNGPAIMIGEKGSDIIKEFWKN